MSDSEETLREITRLQSDIEELRDYRAGLIAHQEEAVGWARFTGRLRLMMIARQIQRHLHYLNLQLELAQESYQKLQDAAQQHPEERRPFQGPSPRAPADRTGHPEPPIR